MSPSLRALGAALLLGAAPVALAWSPDAGSPSSATASLTPAAQLDNVPVGVAVSKGGRVFLAFSRAIDEKEPLSVAELKDGKPVPYPKGLKQENGAPAKDRLLAVQAVYVDAKDRLWILDCGRVGAAPVVPGTAKLLAVDLKTDKVVQTVTFPPEVAGKTSFVNDVRVDLTQGKQGVAFLTDAASQGPNGLIVVDLASGKSVRRLENHPSTRPEPGFVAKVEGQPLIQKKGPMANKPFVAGADGLALSADGQHLYYAPLSGHHLYRVSAAALADPRKQDAEVAATVEDLGDRGFASDGLLGDAAGQIYLTDYENGALVRRSPDGKLETLVKDPRLQWPDTLALAQDGTLWVTVTQIHRGERLQGTDKRERPFTLWPLKTDSQPLRPGAAAGSR